MSIRTRFAPSPTGQLHVGNARTALFCWLYAKAAGGEFMLRLDDTDAARSTKAFADGIEADLRWLGLDYDRAARQSERFGAYDEVFDRLKQAGYVYPCYETPEELTLKRKRQLARGCPPVYDRAALSLSADERHAYEQQARTPHWRFKLSGEVVVFNDIIRGEQKIDTASLSDPVLMRGDGTYLYTLPSVVDDLHFAISDIIRGEDHVTNTATQIELIQALKADVPRFAHHPLLILADGSALSKRLGGLSLADLREIGMHPMAVNSLIARLGTQDAVAPYHQLAELVADFDLTRLGRAPARFDVAELERLNMKILHGLDYSAVADELAQMGVDADETFWLAVRGNLTKLSDAKDYWDMVHQKVEADLNEADKNYIAHALQCLPAEPWHETTWTQWTKELGAQTGRKGRALFMPLRLALTGQSHGPEMQNLLLLIGAARAKTRLQQTQTQQQKKGA